jgi:hypothetical protein
LTLPINCRGKNENNPLDAYWTPPELAIALARLERLPKAIADPCCGSGSILEALKSMGYAAFGSDIVDYGWPGTVIRDYLAEPVFIGDGIGIVSNPPFRQAEAFVRKAISDGCKYHAWLLRTNFLESVGRMPFWRDHPFSRMRVSSSRFYMYPHGYEGPSKSSNQSFSWFIWDACSEDKRAVAWFDWKDLQ